MSRLRRFPAYAESDRERADYVMAVCSVGQWLAHIGGQCEHPARGIIRTVSGAHVCTRCGVDTRADAKTTGGS